MVSGTIGVVGTWKTGGLLSLHLSLRVCTIHLDARVGRGGVDHGAARGGGVEEVAVGLGEGVDVRLNVREVVRDKPHRELARLAVLVVAVVGVAVGLLPGRGRQRTLQRGELRRELLGRRVVDALGVVVVVVVVVVRARLGARRRRQPLRIVVVVVVRLRAAAAAAVFAARRRFRVAVFVLTLHYCLNSERNNTKGLLQKDYFCLEGGRCCCADWRWRAT